MDPISAWSYPAASALNTANCEPIRIVLPTQTKHYIQVHQGLIIRNEFTNPQLPSHPQFFIHQRAYPIIHHALHSLHFPTLDSPAISHHLIRHQLHKQAQSSLTMSSRIFSLIRPKVAPFTTIRTLRTMASGAVSVPQGKYEFLVVVHDKPGVLEKRLAVRG